MGIISYSLDSLYAKINKSILLVESYTEIKNLSFIIKSCRLKPTKYYFGDKQNKTILYKEWFDEYNNSLIITRDKSPKIIYGDLSINKFSYTDLYYGLTIDKVFKFSKLAYISCGMDEDLYQDCFIVSFLGIDNYFRTYLYLYGSWQQISTLFLGMQTLFFIANNLNNCYFMEVDEQSTLPCKKQKSYLTYIPMSKDFSDILNTQAKLVLSTINGGNNI